MDSILSFLSMWTGAINAAFEQYLVISAIFTALAILAFFYLEKEYKKHGTIKNLTIVLIAWLVLVPIVGAILSFFIGLIAFLCNITNGALKLLVATYGLFREQPILIIVYAALSVALYFLWPKLQSNYRPIVRVLAPILVFIIVSFVSVPIANLVTEDKPNNSSKRDAVNGAPS